MKMMNRVLAIGIVLCATAAMAAASIRQGVNWADEVVDYSSKIQNYGGVLMSDATKFWGTGAPDADANGNGYAWDIGEPDYVAGWRTTDAAQYIIVKWDVGIADLSGDDLTIRMYGGPSASATVLASNDGVDFTQIGTIGAGTPGYLRDETFDFAGLFTDDVHYVKVLRVTSGPQTGMFFDSFGGTVPEPTTMVLLIGGGAVLLRRRILS